MFAGRWRKGCVLVSQLAGWEVCSGAAAQGSIGCAAQHVLALQTSVHVAALQCRMSTSANSKSPVVPFTTELPSCMLTTASISRSHDILQIPLPQICEHIMDACLAQDAYSSPVGLDNMTILIAEFKESLIKTSS